MGSGWVKHKNIGGVFYERHLLLNLQNQIKSTFFSQDKNIPDNQSTVSVYTD